MSCRPCPAAAAGLDEATERWPNRSTASDGTCGDPAHAARESDHNPDARGIAHAFDLTHDPGSGCDAHEQADAIRLRAKDGQEPRLKYVISNRRIAQSETGWSWVAYGGDNPHEHHAHFSIHSGRVENDTSPWYESEGFSMADVGVVLAAIRNQSRIQQEVARNQGELTRAAVEQATRQAAIATRKVIWRATGKTKQEIEEGEALASAELDDALADILAAIEADAIPVDDGPDSTRALTMLTAVVADSVARIVGAVIAGLLLAAILALFRFIVNVRDDLRDLKKELGKGV